MKQKMDYLCRVLLTKKILKESKIWVVEGSIFDSPLSMTVGSCFFDNFSTNISTKIQQISKSLLGMSIETSICHLMKNRSQKISLDCPFNIKVPTFM